MHPLSKILQQWSTFMMSCLLLVISAHWTYHTLIGFHSLPFASPEHQHKISFNLKMHSSIKGKWLISYCIRTHIHAQHTHLLERINKLIEDNNVNYTMYMECIGLHVRCSVVSRTAYIIICVFVFVYNVHTY